MAWSDAAREAALQARRLHAKATTHRMSIYARGQASGPGESLADELHRQAMSAKVRAFKLTQSKQYQGYYTKSVGGLSAYMKAHKDAKDAAAVARRMSEMAYRYGRRAGTRR